MSYQFEKLRTRATKVCWDNYKGPKTAQKFIPQLLYVYIYDVQLVLSHEKLSINSCFALFLGWNIWSQNCWWNIWRLYSISEKSENSEKLKKLDPPYFSGWCCEWRCLWWSCKWWCEWLWRCVVRWNALFYAVRVFCKLTDGLTDRQS